MFPKTDTVLTRVETPAQTGTRSYLFDFNKGDFVVRDGKLVECDGMDALKVWIEKILKTEKAADTGFMTVRVMAASWKT